MLRLALKNLLRHPLRTLLTVGSLTVAMFLLCTLRSLVTTLESGIDAASSRRLMVQSAVSLFVDLPLSYQGKIEQVEGVEKTCKWQWFGAHYRDEKQPFTQFAVDEKTLFEVYPEFAIADGSREGFLSNRRGCLVGEGLVESFGWKVGDTIPLIGELFPHPLGPDEPWQFQVEAVYRPTRPEFDRRTLFFHFEYFQETVEQLGLGTPGTGVVVIQVAPGADPVAVMSAVDTLFVNGPRRVQTTPEAEFQAQFISMVGNVPFFVGAIGSAILVAILLASVNTMLLAAREQTRDVGVLKALGFADSRVFLLLVLQGLVLCGTGGGLGLLLALGAAPGIAVAMGSMFPNYAVTQATVTLAIGITLGLGLLAGCIPARRAARMRPIEALGAID